VLGNWSYAPPPHFLFNSDIVRSFLNQSDFVNILVVQCYLSTNENITIILLVPILACLVLTNPRNVSIYNLVNCVVTIYSLANLTAQLLFIIARHYVDLGFAHCHPF